MAHPERTPNKLPPVGDIFDDPAIPEKKKVEMLRALREHAHLRTPKSQKEFVNSIRSAMAGERLTADVGTMPIVLPRRSPPTPRISDLVAQLQYVAAQRVQSAARARAARLAARALRARSLAHRFRPTPTRSGAAIDIARVARSHLARRRLGRGGGTQQQQQQLQSTTSTTAAATAATQTPATPLDPDAVVTPDDGNGNGDGGDPLDDELLLDVLFGPQQQKQQQQQ